MIEHGDHNQRTRVMRVLALVPTGIALNLALGTLVHTLKLPVYLDAVGTICVTLLAGLRAGIVVGIGSFLIGGVTVNPVLPWFSGTQAAIALYIFLVARHGWLATGRPSSPRLNSATETRWRSVWAWLALNIRPVLAGIGLGVVAGTISAPVIAALFGGVTGSGASLIVAFLLESGKKLYQAVLLSGLASEPLDKTLQVLIALALIRALPRSLRAAFGQQRLLERNGLLPRGVRHVPVA